SWEREDPPSCGTSLQTPDVGRATPLHLNGSVPLDPLRYKKLSVWRSGVPPPESPILLTALGTRESFLEPSLYERHSTLLPAAKRFQRSPDDPPAAANGPNAPLTPPILGYCIQFFRQKEFSSTPLVLIR